MILIYALEECYSTSHREKTFPQKRIKRFTVKNNGIVRGVDIPNSDILLASDVHENWLAKIIFVPLVATSIVYTEVNVEFLCANGIRADRIQKVAIKYKTTLVRLFALELFP